MTNHWIDLKNSDCILIMGCNPAENHPISMKWVLRAKEHGATVICVDPRFTKSAAQADIYVPIRPGTDVAFLGGMIKYILDRELANTDYILQNTNASYLIHDRFGFDAAAGLFTGYDKDKRKYAKDTWAYQTTRQGAAVEPMKDATLTHPSCVYQILKRHFRRYDLKTVSEVTGTPADALTRVYAAYAATGAPDKAGVSMYAMGWTQHTVGVQNIRSMAIIQLLLGNMGVAGGGIDALRGESNVQGSTDHALLFHNWPGYLKTPVATQGSLKSYLDANTPEPLGAQSANWWTNTPKYTVSFLKAMFGDKAVKENGFGYDWMPKLDEGANYSWLTLFDAMSQGKIKGFFAWGMNPACSSANAGKVRKALAKLDWMVNVNIFPNETGWFWQDQNLGIPTSEITTEVFVLPAAGSVEKEGSVSNSGRWMQWRYKAADAPGMAKPDADIMGMIFAELKRLYRDGKGAFPAPILNLKWDEYFHPVQEGSHEALEVDPHLLAKEINGYALEDFTVKSKSWERGGQLEETDKKYTKGQLITTFGDLQADGTTSSGCWIYAGSYTDKGNLAARRVREADGIGLHPQWAWCWPVNRRIIYNKASVDPNGQPLNPKRPVIAWKTVVEKNAAGSEVRKTRWVGDVPDGPWPPMRVNPQEAKLPFIMTAEGVGKIFSDGVADGPLPEHYEPLETPMVKNLFGGQMLNPAAMAFTSKSDTSCEAGSEEYPIICSTYRVTEHWQTGVMTRHAPWLLELVPQLFVEMSEELAAERGIRAGEIVQVSSKRGSVQAVALLTKRLRPFRVAGKTMHMVGLPYCFGWITKNAGDSPNLLTPGIGDANTMTPESKAFLVNIAKVAGATNLRP